MSKPPSTRTGTPRRSAKIAAAVGLALLAASISFAAPTYGQPARARVQLPLEDSVGFPKVAIYRPGSGGTAGVLGRYDWAVVDGDARSIAAASAAARTHPRLLTMVVPYGGIHQRDVIAATYGYSKISAPITSPWGTLRAKQTRDDVLDPNGSPHQYGDVTVLNMQQYTAPEATAIWSARVRAKYYLDNVRGHPGIRGIWGDNDFWSDQEYAWSGAQIDRRAWDDGFIAAHRQLRDLLPAGTVIGGNDLSSMADHPQRYHGSVPDGWQLLKGLGEAGMKESANRYYGLTDASGLDDLITGIRRFLGLKRLDGLQRYEMINVSQVDPHSATARLGLAAASISGAYLWGYGGSSGDFASSLDFWMPEFALHGRHWLGLPVAGPVRLARGLWSRKFEHGTVVANASGSARSVAGVTVPDDDAAFVAVENGTAPAAARAASPAAKPAKQQRPAQKPAKRPSRSQKPATPSVSLRVRTYSLRDGERLHGRVLWRAIVQGGNATSVTFDVDGRLSWVERYPPYVFNGTGGRLDTTAMHDGHHTLTVLARTKQGTSVRSTIDVVVANGRR